LQLLQLLIYHSAHELQERAQKLENRKMRKQYQTPTPAERVGRFLSANKPSDDRIPPSAFLGAAAFVAVLFLLMHVGAAVGF
jgi:hypothetical protein